MPLFLESRGHELLGDVAAELVLRPRERRRPRESLNPIGEHAEVKDPGQVLRCANKSAAAMTCGSMAAAW